MSYIDGCVIAVPTSNKNSYFEHAQLAAALFKEHGAIRVADYWGSDVPHGETTDFFRAVQAKQDETIVFSWIEWPDKPTRDTGMQKVMDDPRMQDMTMPFDGKRMIFGGFEQLWDV